MFRVVCATVSGCVNCALFNAVPKLLSSLLKRMSNAANKILQQCRNDCQYQEEKKINSIKLMKSKHINLTIMNVKLYIK